MKDKILVLIIGILIGAIIATAGFFIYTKVTSSDDEQTEPEMMQMNEDGQGGMRTMDGNEKGGMQQTDGNMTEPPEEPTENNGEEPPAKPEDSNTNTNTNSNS